MDEIVIEEKKYISSKRAAKMTGYAKDYIGQLCREGRVPARLVGRSWYVLESAIQDHRFGNPEPVAASTPAGEPEPPTTSAESPRYESVTTAESFPFINHLRDEKTPVQEEKKETDEEVVPLQDSWRAWFDRFERTGVQDGTNDGVTADEPVMSDNESKKEDEEEENEINIPIRTIYHPIYQAPVEDPVLVPPEKPKHDAAYEAGGGRAGREVARGVVRVVGILLAVIIATLAIIGSGYLDNYTTSITQARFISGIVIYNR